MTRKTLSLIVLILVAFAIPAGLFADGMGMIDPNLIGTWKWTSAATPAGNLAPVGDAEYTITFTESGDVHMKFEINLIDGTYEADGEVLTILPPMAMTLASWQTASPAPALLKLLEKARDYTVSGSDLSIKGSAAVGSADFMRQ